MGEEVIIGSDKAGKEYVYFHRHPFHDMCERIKLKAASRGHRWLEKVASWGPQDGRLWIPELDEEGCDILMATLHELTRDSSLFDWQKDWMSHPINVERCQSQGITPEEQARNVREATASDLRRLMVVIGDKLRHHNHS